MSDGERHDDENPTTSAADDDEEEDYEEPGGGNHLLGFMFGNVDDSGDLDADYLDEVELSNILEKIVDHLRGNKSVSFLFLKPVTKKDAPHYLDIIERPMDLGTIKDKVRKMEYRNREEFRHDVAQIALNAHIYNDTLASCCKNVAM